MDIQTTVSITDEKIKNLLCCAFEGGSNYWYHIVDEVYADGLSHKDFALGGKFQAADCYFHPSEIIPTVEGCALLIKDQFGDIKEPKRLDREALQRGLEVVRDKYPHVFADIVNESEDASTGDVFLQCCLFGEAVYG